MPTTAFVYGPHLQAYNPSDDAERALRRELGIDLLRAYGLLDRPDVNCIVPRLATDDEILSVHDPAYVRAVQALQREPGAGGGARRHAVGLRRTATPGRGPGCTRPPRPRAARRSPARWRSGRAARCRPSAPPRPGCTTPWPTGRPGCASTTTRRWRSARCSTAAPSGSPTSTSTPTTATACQWIFYEDPRVLTCSVHESGRYLYPGTGGLAERGASDGEGTSVNVPLPPYAGDEPYLRAVEEVVAPAVRRFRPDVLVSMTGVDPHHTDPMAHLQVTTAAFRRLNAAHARPGLRRRPGPLAGGDRRRLQHRPARPAVGLPVRGDGGGGAARGAAGRVARAGPGAGGRGLHAPAVGRLAPSRSTPTRARAPTPRRTETIDAARSLHGLA